MEFFSACCETCGRYVSKPEELTAYRVRDHKLEAVDLRGERPWSGIRVICESCMLFFRGVDAGRTLVADMWHPSEPWDVFDD